VPHLVCTLLQGAARANLERLVGLALEAVRRYIGAMPADTVAQRLAGGWMGGE